MNTTMKLSTAVILVAATVLALTVFLTKVKLYPDLVVGFLPILFFALLHLAGVRLQMKRPVWPRMAFMFGIWGAASGFRASGTGFLLCGLAFAAIGIVIGTEFERQGRQK